MKKSKAEKVEQTNEKKPSSLKNLFKKKSKEPVVYSQREVLEAQGLNIVIKDFGHTVKNQEKRDKILHILWMILVYALLTLGAVVVLVPFYWMLITSLKSNDEIRNTITCFPKEVMWSNYVTLFKGAGDKTVAGEYIRPFAFMTYLRNTLIVGVISTLGTIITTILAAFAFARLQFKGKNFVFAILIATMMIPGEMLVVTNYLTVAPLLKNYTGVMAAMIIPFWVSVFYIYLLRQTFKQIPNELYYAAKVDGKTDWQYLWKVMVPLATPTLITIFILKIMGAWNSYVWPNLVADKEEWRLMTNGLRGYGPTVNGEPHQGIQMAATVIVTVPLLLLFVFFRKYIMRGVGRAGIKG